MGIVLHCKKRLAIFPSPAVMSLKKLFLVGNNLWLTFIHMQCILLYSLYSGTQNINGIVKPDLKCHRYTLVVSTTGLLK
jgi:hypothetical protein